jgi:hypothetical protein
MGNLTTDDTDFTEGTETVTIGGDTCFPFLPLAAVYERFGKYFFPRLEMIGYSHL